jgi:hypothetical protein
MKIRPLAADNRVTLSERGLHRIDDDLSEAWLDAFVAHGLDEVESFLRRHADFQTFLEDRD